MRCAYLNNFFRSVKLDRTVKYDTTHSLKLQGIFVKITNFKNVNIKLNTFRGKMYNLIKQLRHVVVESK